MTMNILDTIVARKRDEVFGLKKKGLEAPEAPIAPFRGFIRALTEGEDVAVIGEAKKASPSKGLICPDFDPVALGESYQRGGARAMSILTDENFFQGSIRYLPAVRERVTLPILRKDFIIDHIQIEEAALWGADALLLIVAILEDSQIEEFLAHSRERGLDCLVEVHDADELERAMKTGADLVGVNNRNLRDFTVSLDTTFLLKEIVGDSVPLVSESGISTPGDMERLLNFGISAALIGESLVRAKDREDHLAELVAAGRP
jgi:indole-3-glycerol phosphate synthase